jgi:hypothetical protein
MLRSTAFYAVIVAAIIALMSAVGASASPAEKSVRPDGSFQVAASWDRVCCKRGWQDWWSTRKNCRRAGGYVTRNRACREDWNDRWDHRWWGWNGGNWNNRVCCKRGNRDWWSTARECRNAFGYITSNRECRNDRWDNNNDPWNNSWDNRWRNWNSGWNVRICCKRGNQDWWTSARECRNANGYRTYDRECRRD